MKIALWSGIAALAVVTGILLTLAFIDWNHLRRPIAYLVSSRLDRPVQITGPLDVRLFTRSPRVSIQGLELGNLPWAGGHSKVHVERLDAQTRWLPPRTFTLNVVSGATHVDVRGRTANPFALASYRSTVTMSGRDLADLYYLTGLAIPNTPPYRFSSQVRGDARRLVLQNLTGRMGKSDIRGNVMVNLEGTPRSIEADLKSDSLDLVDLAPAFGAGDRRTASGKIFPDASLETNRLRRVDARLKFRAEAIRTRKIPLREVALDLHLADGMLRANRFEFTLPQGKLAGRMTLDATREVPRTELDASLTGVALEQFRPRNAKTSPLEGVLRARAQVAGAGASVHDFVSNANGSVTAVVPHGEIREAFAELTGINVSRGLGLILTKDQERTDVRCGVADFKMRKGLMSAEHLLFDTDDVLIDGGGTINLADERFDLSIRGHPKKLRLLRVRSPIRVRGPLRKPDVGIESGDVVKQGGIAAVLATLAAPLAAAIAFIDPGLADDANCSALLAQAKKDGAPVKTAEILKAK